MGIYWVYNERDLQNQLNMICLSENDASTPQSWPFESGKYGFKPSDFRQNHVHSGVLSIVNVTEHYLPLVIKHDNYSWENHLSGIFHCHL